MPSSSSAGSLSARLLALACLAMAMVSVQAGAAYAKHLFAAIGPEGTTGLRCGISALVLGLLWRPGEASCRARPPWRHCSTGYRLVE